MSSTSQRKPEIADVPTAQTRNSCGVECAAQCSRCETVNGPFVLTDAVSAKFCHKGDFTHKRNS
jgi:hypothetical protein